MFIGEYKHTIDTKGRIVIPNKFREELHSSFIITRGLDTCLTIYSLDQWKNIFEEINKLPTTKKAARAYIRMISSSACECTLDNQGRIQIPSNLTLPVNIIKNCRVIGVNDHIEIWDETTWINYYTEASNDFEEIAEGLSDLLNE